MLAPALVGDPGALRAFARPYREVATRLLEWIDQGRMSEDPDEAVYVHEYTAGGLTVRGVVAAMEVRACTSPSDVPAVLPHEAVHPDQVKELTDRMQEMRLNPAPILLLHQGEAPLGDWIGACASGEPTWAFHDRAGQHHRVWSVRDPGRWAELATTMATAECVVADGHHRYAAYHALSEGAPGGPWSHGLVMVVDQTTTPLHLGAIHRVLMGTTLDAMQRAATLEGALVTSSSRQAALGQLGPTTAVATDGAAWLTLSWPGPPVESLVEWTHDRLLPRLAAPVETQHHHSVEDAVAAAAPDSPALLLPAITFDQLTHRLHAGLVLPEKATSFQPKPSMGVIMRRVSG